MTILSVKEKLKSHTGTAVSSMLLQLKDLNKNIIAILNNDQTKLGYYGPEDGYEYILQQGFEKVILL